MISGIPKAPFKIPNLKKHTRVQSLPSLRVDSHRAQSTPKQKPTNILTPISPSLIPSQTVAKHHRNCQQRQQKSILRNKTNKLMFAATQRNMKKITKYCNEKKNVYQSPIDQQIEEQENLQSLRIPEEYHFQLSLLPNFCYDSNFLYKRVGACMLEIDNVFYLVGGAIRRKYFSLPESEKHKQILIHHYKEGQQNKWVQQVIKSSKDIRNFLGHSVQRVGKNAIAIIGGVNGDTTKTINVFSISIKIYNVQTKNIFEIFWKNRVRWHASCSFQSTMIVHGGINPQMRLIDSLYMVTVPDHEKQAAVIIEYKTNLNLSHHKMISTIGKLKKKHYAMEGIFIFGGEDQNSLVNNRLKFCSERNINYDHIGSNEKSSFVQFVDVHVKGSPPEPRADHSMNFMASKGLIIIIGGLDKKGIIYDDLWLIDILKMHWIEIKCYPSLKDHCRGLARHSAICNQGGEIYIFGGQQGLETGKNNFLKLNLTNQQYRRHQKRANSRKRSSFWSISCSRIQIDDLP